MESQMNRGILELCILYQFLSMDYYGYDLMEKMRPLFPDVKDSTFYVILRRLNVKGYTEIYYGNESNGPQRKYYRITEEGREYLESLIQSWREIKSIVESLGIIWREKYCGLKIKKGCCKKWN